MTAPGPGAADGTTVLRGRFAVSADDPILAGHYPGFPILPGVLLLERVQELVRSGAPGGRAVLTVVDRCRFRTAVRPGDELEVRAELTGPPDGPRRCTAEVRRDGVGVASFRLRFEPPEEGR